MAAMHWVESTFGIGHAYSTFPDATNYLFHYPYSPCEPAVQAKTKWKWCAENYATITVVDLYYQDLLFEAKQLEVTELGIWLTSETWKIQPWKAVA